MHITLHKLGTDKGSLKAKKSKGKMLLATVVINEPNCKKTQDGGSDGECGSGVAVVGIPQDLFKLLVDALDDAANLTGDARGKFLPPKKKYTLQPDGTFK